MGASRKIETELRNRFYAHLQKLSANYFNIHKTGDLMAHATNDIQNIRMALGPGISMSTDTTIIPLAAIVMMFITGGPLLTLVSCLPLAALVISILTFVKIMHTRVRKVQEAFSRLTETARENFSGIRVVKSFVQEESEAVKFKKINEHNREMNIKYTRLMSMLFPTITTISALSFALALWFGGRQVISGHISLGDFVAFTSYLAMLSWPLSALGWITSMFQRGSVSLKRINKILDEKPEIADSSDLPPSYDIKGKIEIRNLTFCYPGCDKPVLKNINITIEKGKTLAIVGKTGSGKTTLANLLLRLYNVQEGTVFIDGVDICSIPLSALRQNIGYAPQDSFLFSTTIKQNIDFFRNFSDDEIVEASKRANVYDNIMDFPEKFETMVGERGITLSGGQKQRISIARALLGNPPVIILDDCLSAVDTQTEEKILEELKGVIKQRTSIIISLFIFSNSL
jgi:ATP-binding cassette subfamily B multidrug efflux pump